MPRPDPNDHPRVVDRAVDIAAERAVAAHPPQAFIDEGILLTERQLQIAVDGAGAGIEDKARRPVGHDGVVAKLVPTAGSDNSAGVVDTDRRRYRAAEAGHAGIDRDGVVAICEHQAAVFNADGGVCGPR